MSGGLIDKVYIGLDNAPAAFDIKGRILGPNGTNLEYIRSETGVVAVLKSDKFEPLHLALHHTRSEALTAARSLAQNLIETIRAELAQWSAAQAGGPPPALNVPPPTLTTTAAPPPVPPPVSTVALSSQSTLTTPHPTVIPPVVTVAPASTPLMTVRQPTVLQLLPQQQYVLNQENGQLIPIVQPGVQVSNTNFTSLPLAQHLGLQQPNFGTQLVDLSSMQPVNVTQLRLSGVPSSMSMILPNGLTFPQANLTSADTTTVNSASTPVVCAAQSTNASQKILYSTDKGDKEVKYHIQGAETVQWAMPGSQTMLIPYQQLQDLTSGQTSLTNLQPQQFVSIAPAGSLPQTSLPLTAAQLQQLQTGTIMQLNQKPIVSSGSLINIISTGQASSPQTIASSSTPTKNVSNQESRGQKRLSDGTPSQLQLRPIAPAGSHVSQDKSTSRDARSWTSAAARDNTVVSMGMKINPAHGTIIHVSSGQQTNVSASGVTHDGTGMYIRQIDRNAIQIQTSKDGQKQDLSANKVQSTAQNVQMITVPQGMTVLQNPLNISQMPTMLGQHNSQVYMIPTNAQNLVQGGLPPGLMGQQVLQPGQNVTVMQPNQLGMPGGVQYNVPLMSMNMPANSQYMPAGINLNTQLSAQQLNAALAGQQLNQNLAVSGAIPIVQAPPPSSPMTNQAQSISVSQTPSVHQLVQQNSFVTPTSQYASMPPQYMMQTNSGALTVPANNPNVQYSLPNTQTTNPTAGNGNGQSNTSSDTDTTNGTTSQTNYITSSSQETYPLTGSTSVQNAQQTFTADGSTNQTAGFTPGSQTATPPNFAASNGSNQSSYNVSQTSTTQPPPNYNPNGSNGTNQTTNQSYGAASTPNSQNNTQTNFSPSTTPAPNQSYATTNLPSMPNVGYPPSQNSQNPYPNATGQNLAAYANNQYQYTSRPWFRPRYGSPQGSPYSSGSGPPNGPPMPVPPPSGNYNYWQDS
ncbi:hypothetical protein evm_001075 [Chilo suppressalis]|nr:hypothetical protein evm_001075 [Chilo suppressalis]